MIDFEREKTLSLSQAADFLPRGNEGKRLHPNTIARWARDGFAQTGIVLETIRVGRQRLTSVEACKRFITALTRATSPDQPEHDHRGHGSSEEIGRELARMGI
jgi:hypothetical protein